MAPGGLSSSGGRRAGQDRLSLFLFPSLDSLLCSTVEISHEIAAAAYSLPSGLHKDPADRILVATARLHDLTLLTADERILDYGAVSTFDART